MPARPNIPMAGESHPPDPDTDRPSPEQCVRSAVLAAFGRSPDLLRVIVRPLWQNHFRVNVFVGSDAASACIAHSYFVEVGTGGDILSANPRLPSTPPLPGRTPDTRR